jgi:ABC-2 type transport system permease protein
MITSIIIFLISAIPSFLSTTMKKAGFGMTIEKLSPLSNVINIMKEIIINKQGLLELSSLLIPFLIWIAAGYMFLRYAVNKLEFKGGE